MKLLLNVTLLTFLFPWLSFRVLDLDTQPWFIIMGTLFVFANLNKKVHGAICFALLLFFSATVVGIVYFNIDFLLARALVGYYGFFIILASYYIMRRYYEFPIWILILSNYIWLLAGMIQMIFGKKILSFLVIVRTTEDRGVTGLAPEPTFYGIFLFFMCWLVYLEKENMSAKNFRILIALNLMFIIFFAKSSMVILYLLISGALYLVFNFFSLRRLSLAFIFGGAVFLASNYFGNHLDGTRVHKLASLTIDAPLIVIKKDASINERASHIFFSIKGFVENIGFPNGYHAFSDYLLIGRDESVGLFWYGTSSNKIMSGIGALLFELGWFSTLFFISVFWFMYSRRNLKMSLYGICLFLCIFMSAITISFTLIPMVMISTYFYFLRKNEGYI